MWQPIYHRLSKPIDLLLSSGSSCKIEARSKGMFFSPFGSKLVCTFKRYAKEWCMAVDWELNAFEASCTVSLCIIVLSALCPVCKRQTAA